VGAVVFLRKHAPPEPARLLPGADSFVYADLRWMRLANVTGTLPSVKHDSDYEQFIQGTGFEFERDLQEAAVAIHNASPASGPETRFSYVFVATIDGDRFRAYLKQLSASTEERQSVTIYNIPLDGRTLRVAILGVDTVAVSNHNDPAVIRGIIERSRKLASPFGGPALLRQFYKHVPLTSLAWAVVRMNPSDQSTPGFVLPKPSAARRYSLPTGTISLNVKFAPTYCRLFGWLGIFSLALRIAAGSGIRVADLRRRRGRVKGARSISSAKSNAELVGIYCRIQHC